TWKVSSGAFGASCDLGMSCAQTGNAASNNPMNRKRFMASPPLPFHFAYRPWESAGLPLDLSFVLSPARSRMEGELLNSPIGDLAGINFVIGPAVEFVHGHEFLHLLAAFAEFALDASVQLHLVNFTVVTHVRGAGGIRAVKVLVLPGSDADGP